MGKPIARRDQYPFAINGIIVDGAKIDGETFVKDLYIYKQRSYNYYDLIDAFGNVYEFIELTWIDQDNMSLNYFDNSSYIVDRIKDNTFFIKIQDIPRNIYGFITLMQLNKVKVHTGDYIFYNQNDDYSLLSVRCIPATIQAQKSDAITIGVQFLPLDYPNQAGSWTADNAVIVEKGRSLTQTATFHCLEVGHGLVTFTPSANSALTATAHIFVTDDAPAYQTFIVMQNDPTGQSLSADNTYFPGDEFTYTAIFTPFDYTPTKPLDVDFDNTVLEYKGTDDNLNYKFKVLDNTTFADVRTRITFSDGKLYAYGQPIVRQLSASKSIGISGSSYARVGERYQYDISYYNKPLSPDYSWSVELPSIGSINMNGELTVTGAGEQKVLLSANGYINGSYKRVYCSPYVPDMYKYSPTDNYNYVVGGKYQMSAQTVPSTVPLRGKWRSRHSDDTEYFTISPSGFLEILKAPDDLNTVFYVGFTYEGSTGVGGTTTDTVQALERAFCIVPKGFKQEPTSMNTGFDTSYIIPEGGKTQTYITVWPRYTTTSKKWTVEIEDPSIVQIDYDSYYMHSWYSTDIELKGLKRGQTTVTFKLVADPSITLTKQVTVY